MQTSSISVGNNDYDLVVHVAAQLTSKTPILIYLTQHGHGSIGSYIYTIGKDTDTYSSVLQQGEDAGVQDLAVNLGRVISRKYSCPSYVCMSGYFSPFEYSELSREVLEACETGKA